MKIFLRLLCSALLIMVGTALVAGPASASPDGGFSVTQSECVNGEGGEVTIETVRSFYVSSGWRTAGLAVKVGDKIEATPPVADSDGYHSGVTFSLTVGPFEEDTTVYYRWFAGPERTDEPLWDATSPADGEAWTHVLNTIGEREIAEDRYWDARDDAAFVNWYQTEVPGCKPAPPTTVTTTITQTETQTEAAQLPVTSPPRVAGLALIGAGTLLAGALFLWYGRRHRSEQN